MSEEAIDLKKIKKVYFIGIGGIGISAVAGILKTQGIEVAGSDAIKNEITDQLTASGIKIFVPQQASNVPTDAELVVYSVAVAENNSERQRATELGLRQVTYPQLLGELIRNSFGLGVSGTDGKTTTTAMIGQIFLTAGLDPTIVVGSKVDYLNGNFRIGQGENFIFESDEYRRAFANYFPRMAVLTNVGLDHLDYYRDQDDYFSAFKDYLCKLPSDGIVIFNNDDAGCQSVTAELGLEKITYAINQSADYVASGLSVQHGYQIFNVYERGELAAEVSLGLPGQYNVYNALAAIAASRRLGIAWPVIVTVLGQFQGAWRRMQKIGKIGETEVLVDYAHTPGALSQVIKAIREFYPDQRVLTVFQPHQYNRTKKFFKEFTHSLAPAEEALLLDIFYVKGREEPNYFDVSSQKLAAAVAAAGGKISYGGNIVEAERWLRENANRFGVIAMIGAGDIYDLAKKIID